MEEVKMPRTSAESLLENVWLNRGFPVDPAWIARKLGLDAVEAEIDNNVSGALIKEKNQDPVIILNKHDSSSRKRFTCAHELGHYVRNTETIDDYKKLEYEHIDFRDERSSSGCIEEEIFANNFAANLLMPRHEVIKKHKEGMPKVLMSDYFGVSDEAITYRLKNLNLI